MERRGEKTLIRGNNISLWTAEHRAAMWNQRASAAERSSKEGVCVLVMVCVWFYFVSHGIRHTLFLCCSSELVSPHQPGRSICSAHPTFFTAHKDGRRVSSIFHSLSLAASSWKYLWKYLLLLYLTFLGNPGNVHCAYVCVGMCVYVCTCVCLPDRDACLCHREWGNKNTEY